MAFVFNHPAPLIIEQPPPPTVFIQQPPPPPVIIEQPPPVFIQQPAPQPVIIEQHKLPVILQNSPPVIAAQPPAVVVQQNGPVVIQSPMKSTPASTKCHFCQQQVVTLTTPVNGLLTWTIFGTLFVFCIWPFCLIPFCAKSCKDVRHICPNCKNVIHVYKRM